MKLVVIEGIGKQETIEKYLGSGYKVFATKGHVRDLPRKTLAVDVKNNFEPKYVIMPDKKEVVEQLKKAASSAESIILATDPDREGEAISWHVAHILNIPQNAPVRIEFNEISKKAVQNALNNPRPINMDLVDAQQARRVLDRLVGYKLSPILCKKIQNGLSAGRVQSVTLKLIVDREREIREFKPEEYWPFASIVEANKKRIKANLITKNDDKIKLSSAAEVEQAKSELDGAVYTVSKVKRSVTKSHPAAPFTTSTMQQDALNKLGMSLKQTSSTAQALYEGVNIPGEGKVALVTYIRTDSTRVSSDAIDSARSFIKDKYGDKYLPAKPNMYASKRNAQDAHEAIRPIALERTPESLEKILGKLEYKLYKLIYERFLASQMQSAEYNSLSVDISAKSVNCNSVYGFKVTGRTPKFDGYTRVYSAYSEKGENKDEEMISLPNLEENSELKFIEYKYEQKFTKPPARYTEASLVKSMEELGIGRPATYTPTISVLFVRKYIEKEGKAISATSLGEKVCDMLVKYFPNIMNVKFTAKMEEELDEIEDNHVEWQKIINGFYVGFEKEIKNAMGDDYTLKQPDEATDIKCELCGGDMVIKSGRYGKFLACTNYPKCKNTKNIDENGNIVEKAPPKESDVICEKCGAKMVIKKGKYGDFLGCPNYPKCKNIKSLNNKSEEKEESLPACPLCGKPLRFVRSRMNGFYGCSGYPDCKFISSNKPIDKKCPTCGSILTERDTKAGKQIKCWNKECDYKIIIPSENSTQDAPDKPEPKKEYNKSSQQGYEPEPPPESEESLMPLTDDDLPF